MPLIVTPTGFDVTTCYGVHFDPFDLRNVFISYTDVGLFKSADSGESWKSSVAGACDVLQKPYCGDELCWVVCTALRRRAMRRPPDRATSTLPCPPPNAGKRAVAGDGLS